MKNKQTNSEALGYFSNFPICTSLATKTDKRLKFKFSNVAFKPIVYKIGSIKTSVDWFEMFTQSFDEIFLKQQASTPFSQPCATINNLIFLHQISMVSSQSRPPNELSHNTSNIFWRSILRIISTFMFSKTSCPNCKLRSYENKKSILYQKFISPICICKIVMEERVSRVLRWPNWPEVELPPPALKPSHQNQSGDFMATGKIWTTAQNAAGELGGCKDEDSVKKVGLEFNWGNPLKGDQKSHKCA